MSRRSALAVEEVGAVALQLRRVTLDRCVSAFKVGALGMTGIGPAPGGLVVTSRGVLVRLRRFAVT